MRYDHKIIASWIKTGSSVLELECGKGDLLNYLKENKQVRETGVDSLKSRVDKCLERGLNVRHGNINIESLDFPEGGFDYVILSRSMQMIKEPLKLISYLLRIGKNEIVTFPNYSNWTIRLQQIKDAYDLRKRLPYEWLSIPESQFMTIRNFSRFAGKTGADIIKMAAVSSNDLYKRGKIVKFMPGLFATTAIFMISRKKPF